MLLAEAKDKGWTVEINEINPYHEPAGSEKGGEFARAPGGIEMRTRAAKGGGQGINNERYEGGQFLPSSPTTIKGEFKSGKSVASTRKEEIAPYKYELAPEGQRSIFQFFSGSAGIWEKRGVSFKPFEPFLKTLSPERADFLRKLIKRWNDGERWFDEKEAVDFISGGKS